MSETTATPDSGTTLEDSLNRTDLGHWLYVYRTPFLAAALLVFVGTSGWLLWKQSKKSAQLANSAAVHRFEEESLVPLREGKLQPQEFTTRFQGLESGAKGSAAVIPVALEAARLLGEKGDKPGALAVLKQVADGVDVASPASVFIVPAYAAAAEDAGQADEAIRVLEAYAKAGHKVMLVKAHLDLGRLYLAKGDKTQAKTHFDYILGNHPNDELAKMARLYQQRLSAAP